MLKAPDFTRRTIETLAKRAAQICSNPNCQNPTSGPHSDETKSITLGEAAHIKGARLGSKRYEPAMSDEERGHISNGIWLCRLCARLIDTDEEKFPVKLLCGWKDEHERAVAEGRRSSPPAAREVNVKGGGVGSIVENSGEGIALDMLHEGKGPAERITVEGTGTGEIISNSGSGTGKRIISTGGGAASENIVRATQPARFAFGISTMAIITDCENCGRQFNASVIIQGFVGDNVPKSKITCPHCRKTMLIDAPRTDFEV